MGLELPADAEPFLRSEDEWLRRPAAYALELRKPYHFEAQWDRHFDTRPDDYWEELVAADEVIYVGGTKDLLGRLEDHRDGEVRQAVLLEVCAILSIRSVWWADGDDPLLVERQLADALRAEEPPTTYVHQR